MKLSSSKVMDIVRKALLKKRTQRMFDFGCEELELKGECRHCYRWDVVVSFRVDDWLFGYSAERVYEKFSIEDRTGKIKKREIIKV